MRILSWAVVLPFVQAQGGGHHQDTPTDTVTFTAITALTGDGIGGADSTSNARSFDFFTRTGTNQVSRAFPGLTSTNPTTTIDVGFATDSSSLTLTTTPSSTEFQSLPSSVIASLATASNESTSSNSSSKLSSGAIAGIVIGSAVGLVLLAALATLFFVRRRVNKDDVAAPQQETWMYETGIPPPPPPPPAAPAPADPPEAPSVPPKAPPRKPVPGNSAPPRTRYEPNFNPYPGPGDN